MGGFGIFIFLVGLISLLFAWPLGLILMAIGVFMVSQSNKSKREEKFQARLLAEVQAQRELIEKERKK